MNRNKKDEEKILAAAVRFLLEGGEKEAAMLLMAGEIENYYYEEHEGSWFVNLRGPRKLYDVMELEPDRPEVGNAICYALKAVLPIYGNGDARLSVNTRMALIDIDIDWRSKLLAEAETEVALNQNPYQKEPIVWKGIRFNSEPEVKIAQALERAGVMYIPNCLVRAGTPNSMLSRFPDFLICYGGKWGILEVDGQKFHSGRDRGS